MTTQTPIHISDRFFAKAARYFDDFKTALAELLQNSYRASLPIVQQGERPRIEITWLPSSLEIRDYGMGITDIGAALSIAVSGWDPSVEEEQDPAGMGLCAALAFSEEVIIESHFGRLRVIGKKFFTDSAYRDALLDTIEPSTLTQGTSVTLLGIKDGAAANAMSRSMLVESVCEYHGAMDVFFCVAESSEELHRVRTFVDKAKRYVEDDKPVSHRGYPVFYSHRPSSYFHYGSERISLIWHGQEIRADLDHKALRRPLTLPTGGVVEVTPMLPRDVGLAVVIDHGLAPVTPKLPDRKSLIYDQKTSDFLWDFVGPRMAAAIQARYDELSKLAMDYPNPERRPMEIVLGTRPYNRARIPRNVEAALYRHFFQDIPFDLPVWNGNDHNGAVSVLCDTTTPRTIIAPGVVLRTSDKRFIGVPSAAGLDDNAAQLVFGSGKQPLENTETWGEYDNVIPEGIAASYSSLHDIRCKAPAGLLVIDVPFTAEQCVVTSDWGRKSIKKFLLTEEPLTAEVYHFNTRPDEDEPQYLCERHDEVLDLLSAWHQEDSTEEVQELLATADSTTSHKIWGVVISDGESGNDPDELIWIGERGSMCSATYDLGQIMDRYEWDEDPELRRQEIRESFSALRHRISGVAELTGVLTQLTEQTGGYISPQRLRRVVIDAETSEISITYQAGEDDATRVSRFTVS